MLVALVDLEQDPELALERAQIAEAGERIGVRLRLELARARLYVRLHRRRLDGAGGLDESLDRLGEALRLGLPDLLAEGVDEHALERGQVACHVGRLDVASTAAQGRERGGALGLLLRQVVGIALFLPGLADDVSDELGKLASDPLGRQLADLVERRALDQTDEPGLRQLVPRPVQTREGSPDRRHRGRSYPRKRRTGAVFRRRLHL